MDYRRNKSQITGLSEIFKAHYENDPELQHRFSIGSNYSGGWTGIVGSTVYGFLAGMKEEPKDTDLLLEKPRTGENIKRLDRHPIELTGFASLRLEYRGKSIDLIFFPSLAQKTNPQMSDFFDANIYNIQNFMYLPEKSRIICNEAGLEALNGRVLRFQNFERAKAAAEILLEKKGGTSIERMLVQMIEEKSGQLIDFKYELPEDVKSR